MHDIKSLTSMMHRLYNNMQLRLNRLLRDSNVLGNVELDFALERLLNFATLLVIIHKEDHTFPEQNNPTSVLFS